MSENSTPPDLVLKGSGENSQIAILIILGVRQPIEVAINLCASFQQKGHTVIVTHVATESEDEEDGNRDSNEKYKLPMLIGQYQIIGKNIYDLRNEDDSELVDAEFQSIVSNLSLDESTQSTYLDALDALDVVEQSEKFVAPNPQIPKIADKVNRIATTALIVGPLVAILTSLTNFDPFGIEPWPGVLATIGGLATLLYRWNLTREEGDDGAHI